MKSALWVIAQREYIQRVKTKGFVIGTLLGPIFMIALIAIPVFVMVAVDEQVTRKIAIVDETGVLADALDFPVEFEMVQLDVPVDTIRFMVEEQLLDGYLLLPADVLQGLGPASFYSRGGGGLMFSTQLQQVVDRAVRQRRLVDAGAPDAVLRILNDNVDVRMVKLTDQGEEADAATALAGIGYVMGFVIYICMFIYGAFVMRGVIEEKTNRIAELIASSARPFQLMMGKVLGIGAMGLTQFLVWCILGMGIMAFGGAIAALFIDPAEYGLTETTNQQAVLDAAGVTIPQIPFSAFVLFVLFFIGGYLLYASLFAAVGSAVEQESDAQQFVLPIAAPIIVPMLMIGHVIESPDSALSFWLSIVPFFSPILMTVRIAATNVPLWQTILALALLGGAFLGSIWISSRIYRVGILMYGKKPSFTDIIRWLRQG
ncbi:MAG: ABC transporter permease [Rhodothermales bacterium]|nr:ABC transporter permease [Rhodothermales bacterium]